MVNTSSSTINIRPGVSILSVLPHLNYKAWYAIAEFVDNAVQSTLDYHEELRQASGGSFKLKVEIEIDATEGGRIVVRDNAAGIHEQDYDRAFRPAAIPPGRHGLSEFGMGMKSAACWFARRWRVRTKALGESVEREVVFDIERIVSEGVETLDVGTRPARPEAHYTEITMEDLRQRPYGRTVGKIREHLCSIYRVFLREDELDLRLNGDKLSYAEPRALMAPPYRTPDAAPVLWEKQIDIDLGNGCTVAGWAALRETGSTTHAGFALFRRSRLIQGSADEAYRPEEIFRQPNSFTYQRLMGELHFKGFGVSHTKDGIQWDDMEERFLEHLKELLDALPLPLLDQAEGYRAKPRREEVRSGAEIAVNKTAETLQRHVGPVLERQITAPITQPMPEPTPSSALPPTNQVAQRIIAVTVAGRKWEIAIELADDPAIGPWVDYSDEQDPAEAADPSVTRTVRVRIATAHPFMERFGGTTSWDLEPLIRIAVALVLGEITARTGLTKYAGRVRTHMNDILRDALSQP